MVRVRRVIVMVRRCIVMVRRFMVRVRRFMACYDHTSGQYLESGWGRTGKDTRAHALKIHVE